MKCILSSQYLLSFHRLASFSVGKLGVEAYHSQKTLCSHLIARTGLSQVSLATFALSAAA